MNTVLKQYTATATFMMTVRWRMVNIMLVQTHMYMKSSLDCTLCIHFFSRYRHSTEIFIGLKNSRKYSGTLCIVYYVNYVQVYVRTVEWG